RRDQNDGAGREGLRGPQIVDNRDARIVWRLLRPRAERRRFGLARPAVRVLRLEKRRKLRACARGLLLAFFEGVRMPQLAGDRQNILQPEGDRRCETLGKNGEGLIVADDDRRATADLAKFLPCGERALAGHPNALEREGLDCSCALLPLAAFSL